jgi:hypothetical protein
MPLAPTLYNPGSSGQDARYDISGLPVNNRGYYTDGTYEYDSNGLDLSGRPADGLGRAPADQMNAEGGGGGGGSYLAGDATYNQMLQDMKAQGVSDKASRDAGIKRSFINFGLTNFDLAKAAQTTGIGDLASILDAETLGLAANNPFSVQKRIERGLADRQRENRVSLRQRGGARSGESGFLAQRAQTDLDTDMFDSSQKLLDYISGAQAAFSQAERSRQMQMWQLALDAAARRASTSTYGGGGYASPAAPSTAPTPVPSWSDNQLPPGTPTMFRSPRDFLNL